MSERLNALKEEVTAKREYEQGVSWGECTAGGVSNYAEFLYAQGLAEHFDDPSPIARAYGVERMFVEGKKHIYPHDMIAGSIRGKTSMPMTKEERIWAHRIMENYGFRDFSQNCDHFAPNYERFLKEGVNGVLERIDRSLENHKGDADYEKKRIYLEAEKIAMKAFGQMIMQYGQEAACMAETCPAEDKENFREMARCLQKVSSQPPESFREALQLTWLVHVAFRWENRWAMAFGRMDQYLYPFYRADIDAGRLTREEALEMLSCTLYKIGDMGDTSDVVNIALGGILPDGSCGVNDLSYIFLEAVDACGIPGPNLSARIYEDVSDDFLDACLRLIGTGIGYPALMNDKVNVPALARYGYRMEDARNYCMVGCIENFIQGKQPPWSDGRFNSPKYLELALNNGKCMMTGVQIGPRTGAAEEIDSMESLMEKLHVQLKAGAAQYVATFLNRNDRFNRFRYAQPFLSCFCDDCIDRGLDINDGGALYPSVHGACAMGIGTLSDSLAAIEKLVFIEKKVTLAELREAMQANFEGFEALRRMLLKAPKYGNDDDFVDKYAMWFVEEHDRLFSPYRTPDGGWFYIAIAANTANIWAGKEIAATPDGRLAGEPLSDAASPMHGMDVNGPTATMLSTSKPDYTKVACGTVLNQKYSPVMFSDPEKRARLLALIRVYFERGGQEVQINSVSRKVLIDAMENPGPYKSMVVRVSGFSAHYTGLGRDVQEDILKRTEHE